MSKLEMKVSELNPYEKGLVMQRLDKLFNENKTEFKTIEEAQEKVLDSMVEDILDLVEIRVCSECDEIMTEGFCIGGGEEYYCSSHCLNQHYTEQEWMAIYAGLDNTDPAEVERASKMSDEELEESNEENDSQSYYTTWEV